MQWWIAWPSILEVILIKAVNSRYQLSVMPLEGAYLWITLVLIAAMKTKSSSKLLPDHLWTLIWRQLILKHLINDSFFNENFGYPCAAYKHFIFGYLLTSQTSIGHSFAQGKSLTSEQKWEAGNRSIFLGWLVLVIFCEIGCTTLIHCV